MDYIDPHIHMVSRITDDYETLAKMGCVAMSEPAFWAGFDRGSADGFRDYFRQLTEVEPKRAAQYGSSITAGSASTPKRPRMFLSRAT
jgi:predicted metal-dependent TIM-barrel fold hydrolase